MQSAWAKFAKNPLAGPGWNGVGTGTAGSVLSGAYDEVIGGIYQNGKEGVVNGTWNVGVLGDVGNVKGSGVTVVPQGGLDYRCGLFAQIYEASARSWTMPPPK
jgi:hypothetical protein